MFRLLEFWDRVDTRPSTAVTPQAPSTDESFENFNLINRQVCALTA